MDQGDGEAGKLTRNAANADDEKVSMVEYRSVSEEREERDRGSEAIHPVRQPVRKRNRNLNF